MASAEVSAEQIRTQLPEKNTGFILGFKEKIGQWREVLGNIIRPLIDPTIAVASVAAIGVGIYLMTFTPDIVNFVIGGGLIVGGIVLIHTDREVRPGGGY